METQQTYRFGTCEVDARSRQIRHDGALMEAQPKPFDLLLYLIDNRDRVVDKEELFAALWPGVVVSDSALTQVVRKARSLVGDDGNRQAVIRTVQRRGFRFVAALDTKAHEDPATESTEESVAVLPFADMSPDRDQEYFCDGMTEEIINELTHVPHLRVAARTSSFVFKDGVGDVREIARRLGVSSVLEGSVRKSGDMLRVTAQLIEADTGFHLWSERWDRELKDMLVIQAEIAHRISIALRRPEGQPATPAFTAHDLCERGFAYLHRSGRRSQRFAMDLFHQALALEPESARAYAGLALCHAVLSKMSGEPHRELASRAIDRALRLDTRCAEAWVARTAAAWTSGDFRAAEQAFVRAVDLAPMLFEAYYYFGHACTEIGDFERAAAQYERAAELRPDDYSALVFARQVYGSLGWADLERDASRRQLAAAERALAADPTDARALSLSGASLIVLGKPAEARTWSHRACELEPEEGYVHYNAACTFALLGETEPALATLEHAYENNRFCRPSWLERDEDLAALRDEPRFKALLARSRARTESTSATGAVQA